MWRRRPGRSIRSSIRTGRRIWTRRGCICSRLDVASHIKTRNLAAFLTPRIQEAAAFLIIECVRDRVIVKGGGKEHETISFVRGCACLRAVGGSDSSWRAGGKSQGDGGHALISRADRKSTRLNSSH